MKIILTGLLALLSLSVYAKYKDLQTHTWNHLPVHKVEHNNKFLGGEVLRDIYFGDDINGSYISDEFINGSVSCFIKTSKGPVLSITSGDVEIVFVDTNSFGNIQKSYYSIVGYTYDKSLIKINSILYLNCKKEGSFLSRNDLITTFSTIMKLKKNN